MASVVRRIILGFAAALLVASIAALVLFAWPRRSEARSAASWPVVEGTVVRCEIVATSSRGPGRRGPASYGLDLLVRYEIDGVTLLADRDAFDSFRTSDPDALRTRADELRPGARVPVRYDPDDPGRAVLRAEGGWIPFVLPAALLLMSGVVALVARFSRPSPMLHAIGVPRRFRLLGAALLGIIASGFLVFGLVASGIGLGRLRALDGSAAWPEREATVLQSAWSFDTDGSSAGARPSFRYRYEVDGVMRESDAIAPVPIADASCAAWNRRILAWRPGERVPVRVDPEDPSRAALERPSAAFDRLAVAIAATFAGLGGAGMVLAVRIVRGTHPTRGPSSPGANR